MQALALRWKIPISQHTGENAPNGTKLPKTRGLKATTPPPPPGPRLHWSCILGQNTPTLVSFRYNELVIKKEPSEPTNPLQLFTRRTANPPQPRLSPLQMDQSEERGRWGGAVSEGNRSPHSGPLLGTLVGAVWGGAANRMRRWGGSSQSERARCLKGARHEVGGNSSEMARVKRVPVGGALKRLLL